MITAAPLPRLSDLGRAVRNRTGTVPTPWLKPWDTGLLAPRGAWSLAAVARAVAARKGHPARVLLPGWICNQSLDPLRRSGAQLTFLPVTAVGVVEWKALPVFQKADMVVVVHPFGFPAPLSEARKLADRLDALLIEDAAHCLKPADGIHEAGDVVLYSPHKLVAAPAGGIVAIRHRAGGWAEPIARQLGDPPSGVDEWPWLARRLIQAVIPDVLRPLLPQGGQDRFETDPETVTLPPPAAPSSLARRLLAEADLEAEAVRRRANEAALRKLVMGHADLVPLFPAKAVAPYRMALRAASPDLASRLYARLRAARLPVESWPDLAPEVLADPAQAAGAVALRRSVLLLPVHGALEPKALARAYGKVLS